jgi:opacity protein-like surface antigen
MKRLRMFSGASYVLLALSALFLCCTWPAQAEEAGQSDLPDRFMIRGGYLYVFAADTNIQLNGPRGFGTNIDFNRTLGGGTDYSGFRIDGMYRLNERHSLGLSYYRVLRDANRTINADLTVRDTTIAAGANVTSSLNFDMWRLIYNYSFYRNEKVELGLSPGLYMAKIKFSISGDVTCSGTLPNCSGQTTNAGSSSEDLTVPLPSVGGFLNYNITPKLKSQVRFDWFYLQVGDTFTGSLFEFYAGLEYRLFKHFGLGASYDRLQVNADLHKQDSPKAVNILNSWNTVFLYGALYF